MKDLIKYELKKHIKTVLGLMIIVFLILSIYNSSYLISIANSSNSYESTKIVLATFIFIFMRTFIFGLFIYFVGDFIKNLMTGEKNTIFCLPVKTETIILSKIVAITLLVGLLMLQIFLHELSRIYMTTGIIGPLSVLNVDNYWQAFVGLISFFSLCLVALLIAYWTILVCKKWLEKTRFQFLWLVPFALCFSVYLAIITSLFMQNKSFIFASISWGYIGVNMVTALLLFKLICHLIDKKVDI